MVESRIPEILQNYEKELLEDWLQEQGTISNRRTNLLSESETRQQSAEFLSLFRRAMQSGNLMADISAPEWTEVRENLASLSRFGLQRGFTPTETATFVFSLKHPLFMRLRQEVKDTSALADELWTATALIDELGLYTTERYQESRQEMIERQQQEILELSTPVIKLWQGILALPLIGTLDSARTQVMMENLLQQIVDNDAAIAIIDITGVPTVDTLVAQHLLKTTAAARLMGADCIISGIRPQIAQTIVQLGVELNEVTTKATLASAFRLALQWSRQSIASTSNEHARD